MSQPNYNPYIEYHYWAWVLTPPYPWEDEGYTHKARIWETWQANLFNNEEDR